jgi:hypothetical protein
MALLIQTLLFKGDWKFATLRCTRCYQSYHIIYRSLGHPQRITTISLRLLYILQMVTKKQPEQKKTMKQISERYDIHVAVVEGGEEC